MPGLVNKQQLAELQGVSIPTITKWVSEGCPFESKGGRGRGYDFDSAKVTEWRIEQGRRGGRAVGEEESEASGKRRKMSAEADMAEMKSAEMAGELIRAEDLVVAVQNDLAKVKARLMAIPNRLAPLVIGMTEVAAKLAMDKEVNTALNELVYIEPPEELVTIERRKLHEKEFTKKPLHIGQWPVNLAYDVEWSCIEVVDKM